MERPPAQIRHSQSGHGREPRAHGFHHLGSVDCLEASGYIFWLQTEIPPRAICCPSARRHLFHFRRNQSILSNANFTRLSMKIDVLQSRPSAGGHKILNFTSKILDFLTTGYLPFCDFFTFSQGYSYVFWIQLDYVFSNI